MSALVIDTSSWISYFRDRRADDLIDSALGEGRVYVPVVVVGELLSGKLSRPARRQLQAFLRDLPQRGDSFEHWCRVGDLRRRLMEKRVKVSTPDAHVAQVALDLGARLLTEDAVFPRMTRHTALQLQTI